MEENLKKENETVEYNSTYTNNDVSIQYEYNNFKDNSFGKNFIDALKLFRNDATVEEIVKIFG